MHLGLFVFGPSPLLVYMVTYIPIQLREPTGLRELIKLLLKSSWLRWFSSKISHYLTLWPGQTDQPAPELHERCCWRPRAGLPVITLSSKSENKMWDSRRLPPPTENTGQTHARESQHIPRSSPTSLTDSRHTSKSQDNTGHKRSL